MMIEISPFVVSDFKLFNELQEEIACLKSMVIPIGREGGHI